MAKRSSTIYLEDKFWDMLTDYQNENNLTSRNDALQLILNEWSILKRFDISNIVVNVTGGTIASNQQESKDSIVTTNSKKEEVNEKNPIIEDGMKTIFGSMK